MIEMYPDETLLENFQRLVPEEFLWIVGILGVTVIVVSILRRFMKKADSFLEDKDFEKENVYHRNVAMLEEVSQAVENSWDILQTAEDYWSDPRDVTEHPRFHDAQYPNTAAFEQHVYTTAAYLHEVSSKVEELSTKRRLYQKMDDDTLAELSAVRSIPSTLQQELQSLRIDAQVTGTRHVRPLEELEEEQAQRVERFPLRQYTKGS